MAEFGVGFKLYADSAQFQREMKQAVESAKNVQKGLKDIGVNVGSMLGIGAVAAAFMETARAAQSLRDEAEKAGMSVSDSVASVARLADSIDSLKSGARDLAINTLGVFTKIGDEIGEMWLWVFEGQSMQSIKANEKISKDADDTLKRIAKARQEYNEKVQEADERLAKAQRDNAIKRAGDEDKLNALLTEQARIQEEINKTGKNTLKARELQIESENNITAIVTERDRIAKRSIEEEAKATKEREKATADAQKIQDEYYKKTRLGREEEIEFTRLQLKGAENLNRDERARYEILALQTKQKQVQVEIDTLLAIPASQRGEGEKRALGLLFQQSDALSKQITAKQSLVSATVAQANVEQKVTSENEKQLKIISRIDGIRTSKQFGEASDEALREVISRNRGQAANILNPALGGGSFNRAEAARLEFEARNAQQELAFRESLRRDVQMFGEEGARRNFKGDPLKFDALLQQYVTDTRTLQEIQKEGNDQLKDLNARLGKFGFTK